MPALDERQLRTLRRVGREWGRVCGEPEQWRRALPVDPNLGEYPDPSEIVPTRFGRFVPVALNDGRHRSRADEFWDDVSGQGVRRFEKR